MKIAFFAVLAFAAVFCTAEVLETWKYAPADWVRMDRCDGSEAIELTLAVSLTNTQELEQLLITVSDPDSSLYGKHMTKEELDAFTAPTSESVQRVASWLKAYGITDDSIIASSNYGFIKVSTTVKVAEKLLNTQYYTYKHKTADFTVLRTNGAYEVPTAIAADLDFISPTIRFPVVQRMRIPKSARTTSPSPMGLGGIITPAILRTLYGVNSYSATNPNNRQACASFLGQFYAPSDLQTFFNQFDSEASGRTPKLYGPNEPSNPGVEASLDIEYIMAMGNNVSTQFWSTPGQQPHNPENEPFLVWLTNVSDLSDSEIPLVISVSYGDNEGGVNYEYAQRVNAEFQKLGARGISIMFSSGDGGVAGGQSSPCQDGKFIPTFPAGSPWVTAVGGTASSKPEVAASFSSGGFSNYWARPDWQKDAVTHYFSVASGLPAKSHYNQTGAGIPDVSAQSESFNVVQGGSVVFGGVDGTSCSSPTFSGIMSLLNDARLNAGKSSLGFLNPLFYKNADAFNDVTSGSNPGCGTNGFPAAQGWDPVTGLGTPNFAKLKNLVLSLQ